MCVVVYLGFPGEKSEKNMLIWSLTKVTWILAKEILESVNKKRRKNFLHKNKQNETDCFPPLLW